MRISRIHAMYTHTVRAYKPAPAAEPGLIHRRFDLPPAPYLPSRNAVYGWWTWVAAELRGVPERRQAQEVLGAGHTHVSL
jgi:hypothetical protein